MMQLCTTKCPSCGNMVSHLNFWRQIGDKFFHICDECMTKEIKPEALLLIGFHYGYEMAQYEMKKFLSTNLPH